MGIIGKIFGTGIKESAEGIGTLAKDIRQAITGELSEAGRLKLEELEMKTKELQTRVNEVEAGNPNIFVSGWRPAAGWVCVIALAYQAIINPFLAWLATFFDLPVPFALDISDLITMLFGMLGLGAYRTYEKIKK